MLIDIRMDFDLARHGSGFFSEFNRHRLDTLCGWMEHIVVLSISTGSNSCETFMGEDQSAKNSKKKNSLVL